MEIPCSDHIDLGWKSRCRRSKRPDFNKLAAAKSLILLANCDGGFCPSFPTTTPPKNLASFPHPNSSPASVSAAVNIKNKKRYSPDTPLMANSSIFHPKKHRQQQKPASTAVNVKNRELYSPETPIMAVARHECLVCGKRFQTHQSLGGHMTSHRPKPKTTTVSGNRGDGNSSAVKKGRTHDCKSCHKRFSTGQALGGHKRKHFNMTSLPRKSANCRRSISFHIGRDDGGAASSLVSRPSIDLNMPPPEE